MWRSCRGGLVADTDVQEAKTELDWEQTLETIGRDLADIETQDALGEDGFCDHGHQMIARTVEEIVGPASSPLERAKNIYRFAREEIDYTFLDYKVLPASETLKLRVGGCLNKSIMATALYRRAGIPAVYGIGLLKNQLLSNLIGKLVDEVWNIYLKKSEWIEAHAARWTEVEGMRDRTVQGDKNLHITSCIHVGGRWFEADVTQNNKFMTKILQADKYFPRALAMWDGSKDFGVPDHFYAGGKKRLKYLTVIEDLRQLYDFNDQNDDHSLSELFNDLRKVSGNIELWLGSRG
jgi:transglutaminase superfamily protein